MCMGMFYKHRKILKMDSGFQRMVGVCRTLGMGEL